MGVFFLFLLATSLGSLSTLYWIPERDTGRGYFQMNALVVLGLLSLAAAVLALHPFHPFGERPAAGVAALAAGLAGGFLYYAAIWRERWDRCCWPACSPRRCSSAGRSSPCCWVIGTWWRRSSGSGI